MDTVAQKTGLPKAYVVYGVIGLVVGFFFFGLGAGLFWYVQYAVVFCVAVVSRCRSNLIGFVYPAYMSFKAIESEDKNDDTMWLTYWVVYSFFTIIEGFADVLLFWIPFYYAAKLAFLFWLFLPMTQVCTCPMMYWFVTVSASHNTGCPCPVRPGPA